MKFTLYSFCYCGGPGGTKPIASRKQNNARQQDQIPKGHNQNHLDWCRFNCNQMMESFHRWLDASSLITETNNLKTQTAGRSQFLPTSDNFLVLRHHHVNSDGMLNLTSKFPQGHKKTLFSSMNWTVTRIEKWLTHFALTLCIWNEATCPEPRGAS